MKRNCLWVFVVAVMLLAGCASVPTKDIKVDAQLDSKADFSGYKSYTWLGAASIVNDSLGQWEPPEFDADAEVTYLIDRELRKRGLSEDSNNPDLIIAFAAGIDMDALGLKVDPETKIDMMENVPQGGLLIMFMDSKSGFVVWVGAATAEIQDNIDEKTIKARLDYVVTQLFKKLPK